MEIVSACIARDLPVYRVTCESLRTHLENPEIHVVTRREDFARFRNACGSDLKLWDEAELVEGMTLPDLRGFGFPYFPEAAGWYFQQFLKFAFHRVSGGGEHYLIWDADTVLLQPVRFLTPEGVPIYTRASEYHRPYFETFEALFGEAADREFSFISQHQVISKSVLRGMLAEIEERHPDAPGWAWAIMRCLRGQGSNLFSEYETYGHYLKLRHPGEWVSRDLEWTRHGGGALGLRPVTARLRRLARNYEFAAFEASASLPRRLVRALRDWRSR